jgi:NADH-quinone oxidoreductase subunit M
VFPYGTQLWLLGAFAIAFAIKVPLFPLHTWLPDAHVQAPTGGSVILAAVLLKFGIYGYYRFAMPLFPLALYPTEGQMAIGPTLAVLGVIGIVWGAWCAWVQRDLKKLVAYSSVSHMGFVMLGLFAVTQHGVAGSILQMVNHGISTGALFILVGVIYERRHTRDLEEFGGLAKVMPWYTVAFVVIALSSAGLPGTNGFVGEFMILAGSFMSRELFPWPILYTVVAATGVIFAAIYLLHAVLKIFWGPIRKKENERLKDLTWRESVALLPLIVLVFWIGIYPAFFLDRMEGSVAHFLQDFQRKLDQSREDDSLRLLEAGEMGPPIHRVQPAAEGEPEPAQEAMAVPAADGRGGDG